jgi:hypothetical protein
LYIQLTRCQQERCLIKPPYFNDDN